MHQTYGVLRVSVLGPMLFTLYMFPLGNVMREHSFNFHWYVDDTQYYSELTKPEAFLKDIKVRMTSNFLLINSDKTEAIVLASKHC